MSAMRKFSGEGSPEKRRKPDGAPDSRRAGKGRTTGKPASGGPRGYTKSDHTEGSSPSGDRSYKSRKPYAGRTEGNDGPRPYRGNTDDKPARPWKRDEESGAPRERRFSDSKPTGERPYKSRKPFDGKREGSDSSRIYKGNRDEKPGRPWKKDDESGAPRERRFSDSKPSGDRPYKSHKPVEGRSEGKDAPRSYREFRDSKPTKPWKRDEESGAPRERRFLDSKPTGDRPYKSRKPIEGQGEGTDTPRPYKGSRDDKPGRPWKRDEASGAPRESRFSDSKPSGDRPYKSRKPIEGEAEGHDTKRTYKSVREEKPLGPWKRADETGAPREKRTRESSTAGPRPRIKSDEGDDKRGRSYRDKDEAGKTPGRFKKDGGGYGSPKSGAFSRGKSSDTSKSKADKTYADDGTIRLNKFISNSGVCSRREADRLIESGVVTINGVVVTELGTKITREDKVQFGGETLNFEKKVYLLLNKPKGYITTVDDPQERNTVMMLIKDACRERVYPVGRLDRNTSGLLLFTNDGEMAKKLTHPGHKVRKVYHVELDKSLAKSDMMTLSEGVELEDGIMAVDEIAYTGVANDKKNIGVVIHSGRNRVVRRLFELLGYEIVKLDRVAFGNLTKKDLPRGRWRFLEESELNLLKMV